MKNKIISIIGFLVLMCLLVSQVQAQDFMRSSSQKNPYIIDGFAGYVKDGENIPINDASVYIKNLRTGYVVKIFTNDDGYFLFDLNNLLVTLPFEDPYKVGDNLEVYMTNAKVYEYQIGSRYLCEYYNSADCDAKGLTPAQGGFKVDFTLEPTDTVTFKGIPEPMTIEEWWTKFKQQATSPLALVVESLLVIVLGILAVKYKWGKSFYYLTKYWIVQKKDYTRAVKMMRTAIKRDKEGYYQRKR